jgi:hypothetical protein
MQVSAKQILLGAALLMSAMPAIAAEETASSAVAPVKMRATVSCPGITSVQMTSDAEQALPLRLVGSLGCGEGVSILADNEGYTAHVRTDDGREGFVARMYLSMMHDEAPAATQAASSATPVNGVVRWQAGAPGCSQFESNGRMVESITANGITVQVALQDTGWKLRANVAFANASNDNLVVMPSMISLDELQPGLKVLRPADASHVAHALNHQVLWTESTAQPSPSAVVLRSSPAATVTAASYHMPATDYSQANLTAFSVKNGVTGPPASIKSLSLKAATLAPGQKEAGVLWFERDVNARELSMRVPAGDMVFDFPLSFSTKK